MGNDRVRFLLIGVLVLFGAATAYAVTMNFVRHETYIFPGVTGPSGRSLVAPRQPTSWQGYANGSASRLAVLLTDSNSSWLGLAHALKSFGVPFRITTDTQEALKHKVVLVYPRISGKVLSKKALKAIAAFPRKGGHLIGINVLGGGLKEVFGFREAVTSRQRFALYLDPSSSPLLEGFTDERERTISLGNPERFSEVVGTLGYSDPREPPLAIYDDGSAAITARSYSEGRAYAFGFDVGDFFFRAHHGRHHAAHRSYVNSFEPTTDVVARLIRKIYLRGNPDAVIIGTVPGDRKISVMFSFDIDTRESYERMLPYAEFLRSIGTRGTFFIQTKYIRDYNDAVLFDSAAAENVRQLARLGMEVASHTVSHSDAFAGFPLGTGDEDYPDYQPIVVSRTAARNGTILGELRVSKFLLETLGETSPVISFRPGYLAYPVALPQALEAAGYRYSSSMTANKALSHLPFQLNYGRRAGQEVDIFEIPATVEDEKPPAMGSRVASAIELARKISRYGGTFVVLTHPTVLDHKLEFHKALYSAVKDWAWIGSISDFGRWWAARNEVEADIRCAETRCGISLYVPRRITALPVHLPKNCVYEESGNEGAKIRATERGVVVGEIEGELELVCRRPQRVTEKAR